MATKKRNAIGPAPAMKGEVQAPNVRREETDEEKRANLDAAWAKVQAITAIPEQMKLKGLLYAPNGFGKSRAGAIAGARPLIAVTEKQAIPVINHWNKDARTILINKAADLADFGRLLHDPRMQERHDVLVLDSLTDVMRLIKDHLTANQKSGRDTTDENTWGLVIEQTGRIVRQIRDVPMHVLVICTDNEREIEGMGLVHRPNVYGKKFPGELGQYFNCVGYGHVRQVAGGLRRQVMLDGPEQFMVKSMDGLPGIVPPEPRWWIAKRFGGDVPEDVQLRVDAWDALDRQSDNAFLTEGDNPSDAGNVAGLE